MDGNQLVYLLSQSNSTNNIEMNLNNLDYYAMYEIKDYLYLFERDQIIKKYQIHVVNYCYLNQKYGFSRNGEFFFFLNQKEDFLSLIELQSKKEYLIQLKEQYNQIQVNQFIVLQSNQCFIDFLNFQTNDSIRFQKGQNRLTVLGISKNNQYLICEKIPNSFNLYLIQHNGAILSILHKFTPFLKGFETPTNQNLVSQMFIMNLQQSNSQNSQVRLFHMNSLKLIRKFFIIPQAQNQGIETKSKLQFFSTSIINPQSYLHEINLETGEIFKLMRKQWQSVTGQFKLIDQTTKDKISEQTLIVQQLIKYPLKDHCEGLVYKWK